MRYQPGKYLRVYYEGVGNINYEFPASGGAGVVNAANDGLSTDAATSKIAQLGQTSARALDPAKLLENREIPLNNFVLSLRNVLGADTVDIAEGAVNITGDSGSGTGSGGALLSLIESVTGDSFTVLVDATGVIMTWDGGLIWQHLFGKSFLTMLGGLMLRDGLGAKIRSNGVNLVESFGDTDYTLLMDTSTGNATVALDPVAMRAGRIGNIKKISTDLNTITLNATSGLIFGVPPGAASLVFSNPGDSLQFQSDGTNIYII